MALSWRYLAPVVVPDTTHTAVIRFYSFDDASICTERWPVVAWLIELNQHSGSPNRKWTHPEPITINGIIHDSDWSEKSGFQSITCLETDDGTGGRVWQFATYQMFSSLKDAHAFVLALFARSRAQAAKDRARKAAKRRKAAKARVTP